MKKWKTISLFLLFIPFIVILSYKLGSNSNQYILDENNDVGSSRRELVVKTKMTPYSYEILKEIDDKTNKCRLLLLATSYKSNLMLDISHPYYRCSTFKDVTVMGYYDYQSRNGSSYLFVESAFGGDGEHTPPILKGFKIDKSGIIKLGEMELVNVSYIRRKQIIDHILAEEIIDFCFVCDGWDAASKGSVFFIPVKITVGCDGLCKQVLLSEAGKKEMIRNMKKYRTKINEQPDSESQNKDLEMIDKLIKYAKDLFNTSF